MKKILIYAHENELRNIGGPSGYLFNIKDLLSKSSANHSFQISLLSNDERPVSKLMSVIRSSKYYELLQRLSWFFPVKTIANLIMDKGSDVILNFEIIHFHSTLELFSNRKKIKNKVVIIQSHSPVPLHKEIYEVDRFSNSCGLIKLYLSGLRFIFSHFDYYAFKKADYIVFPTEYSIDAYMKNPKLSKILKSKKLNIHFVISGILDPIKHNKNPKLKDNSQITFGYLGRHNHVKGYDRFVKVMGEVIRENPNCNVLVGGTVNNKIPFPKSDSWNELGWINQDVFFSSIDVHVLPNRETYFDLVLLEALAFGKIVLISYTGGNKYFTRFKGLVDSSIYFFENDEEFMSKINFISQHDKSTLKSLGMKNREIFLNNFQAKNMLDEYYSFLRVIV